MGKIFFLDIGNSSLKWAMASRSDSLVMQQKQYPEKVSYEFFMQCWQDLEKPTAIFVSCVAEAKVFTAITKACDELWSLSVHKRVAVKEDFGLINAYEDAASLGCDRWCGMIAAQALSGSGFMVIDAGSALTIDLVDTSGQHLGGYIVPGLRMMQKSLALQTAQVQTDEFDSNAPSLLLANSTNKCVEAGIHLSTVKLIESVIDKHAGYSCFITGGDANLIAALLPFKCVIIPELVLMGLARLALEK